MSGSLAYINVFSSDIDRLAAFYAAVFGFEEIAEHRSPIHRGLRAGGVSIGFNAEPAYGLLNLSRGAGVQGDRIFMTFELAGRDAVDQAVAGAVGAGASIVKSAADTPYGWYQAVLRDVEGNAFRINYSGG